MHGMQGHEGCCHCPCHCCGDQGQMEEPLTKEQKQEMLTKYREKLESKLAMIKEKEAKLKEEKE
jgi:hypothetical protein